MGKECHDMIYDKKKGSLLNYIQLPLNVVTPKGTYLGIGYDAETPKYILSHIKLTTFAVGDLVFSNMSKAAIVETNEPLLEVSSLGLIGYKYDISATEDKFGYITVASSRIDISKNKITKDAAVFILDKQLRSIGNILERFVTEPLSQPQFDALLYYFFHIGVSKIENSAIITLINMKRWYDVADEIQDNIKRNSGKVDEHLAAIKIRTAKMWSYVPGF